MTEELINNIANAGSFTEADDLLENISTLKDILMLMIVHYY